MPPSPVNVIFRRFRDPEEPSDLCCRGLVRVVEAWRLEDVLPRLIELEEAVNAGLYAAGMIAYEAAAAMDAAAPRRPPGPLPLVWFGLFREMISTPVPSAAPPGGFSVGPWRPSITEAAYQAAIDRIKDYIARGHTYQVNYTFRLRSEFAGDPRGFFHRLADAQRGQFGAYLDMGRHVVCSASPELFFRLDGDLLTARPMKGTAPRGLTLEEDRRLAAGLAGSAKDRAENAMIVDMMRNDLGRIARRGSVRVAAAFDVEKYPTVLQMTSTVTARSDAPIAEILRAVFPPASITGAPKLRTMEIIGELEADPRGVYTGCVGYLAPGRQASFNVAIRTVWIDRAAGRAEYGVGGGIVWDSSHESEYAECAAKAAVLTAEIPRFELLETLLWDGGDGYFLLEGHLRRLADSAEYFAFALDLDAVRRRLDELGAALADGRHRVRLCVNRRGEAALASAPLAQAENPPVYKLRLAARPIDRRNPFLYHKTTHRGFYPSASPAAGVAANAKDGESLRTDQRPTGADQDQPSGSSHWPAALPPDDFVLWNEQGQATETTIANLVVEQGGRLVTPPVSSGLLPGVFRRQLLETGQIVEEVVMLDDLRRAERVFAVNSVRKWMPAAMIST